MEVREQPPSILQFLSSFLPSSLSTHCVSRSQKTIIWDQVQVIRVAGDFTPKPSHKLFMHLIHLLKQGFLLN